MVIGGTGMLAGLCRTLAERGHRLSVLARRPADLGPGVRCFPCDYTDAVSFEHAIRLAIEALGQPEVLITWIHSTVPNAEAQAARLTNPARHMRILGSAGARRPTPGPSEVGGERIILGFALEKSSSRWLTNAEIGAGVLGAFDHPMPESIVGVIEPWDRRPC